MTEAQPSPTPAAPAQSPLWLLQQLEPESSAYNLAFHLELSGPLDADAMRSAWRQVIERHRVLRCRFISGEHGPLLLPLPPQALPLGTDICSEADLEGKLQAHASAPFNLELGPPCRATLFVVGATHHLAFAFHHSVFDGWSLNLLLVEMAKGYNHALGGGPALSTLERDYLRYAQRIHAQHLGADWGPQLDYWREHLSGAPAELDLPRLRREPNSPRTGRTTRAVHQGLADPLQALCASSEATPFMVLLAAYVALLGRYTDADDLVIGTPLATRLRPQVRKLIGLCLNTVALRIRLNGAPSFLELIQRVKEAALGAFRHYEAPFDKVVQALHPERRQGQTPLFSAMFITQNAPVSYRFQGLSHRYFDDAPPAVKFDITLSTQVMEEDLHTNIEYADDRLDEPTARGMLDAYQVLLKHGLENPEVSIKELSLMDRAGRQVQTQRWRGARSNSTLRPLLRSIEKQAKLQPTALAASDKGQDRTYAEVWAAAERIARTLAGKGVAPGDRVGVRVARDAHLPEILLGVLRAGAAYVPLDPHAPAARRRASLEDAQAKLLIVDQPQADEAPSSLILLSLEHIDGQGPLPEPPELGDPAYIIYTSGSSGRPKGVQISHRALASFSRAVCVKVGLQSGAQLLATTTVGFDIAVLELLTPLSIGARVHVLDRDVAMDGQRLGRAISDSGAQVFQTTPSALRILVNAGWSAHPGLKVLAGGEALPRDLACTLLEQGCELWNMYGPTEATVWVSARRIEMQGLQQAPDVVPIGDPFDDCRMYILSAHGKPVPPGARGELCLAGPQVADGYVGRPELNSSRFVADPFEPGTLLYRTGDVVRAQSNDSIEFLGRCDQQLKIRGFRVEPAEIEALIRRQPGLHDAVVTTMDREGTTELVAYVITHDASISQDSIRASLREHVPAYMVPAFIHSVPEIPRNSNGKLDRARLPKQRALRTQRLAEDPHDQVEAQLLELWRSLLGRRQVGTQDNFFDIGGHSMLAAKLADRVQKSFAKDLPVATFFHAQTVAQQAQAIREGGFIPKWLALDPIKSSGTRRPVFYIGASDQARWLADKLPPEQPLYALKVLGLPEDHPLTIDAISATYVKEMTQFQPQGPYALAAYCQDAKLALAVARRLQAQGEVVASMVYIDTVWVPQAVLQPGRQLVDNFIDLGPRYAAYWLKQRTRDRVKSTGKRVFDSVIQRASRRRNDEAPITTQQRDRLRAFRRNLDAYPESTFDGDLDILLCQEFHRPGAERALSHMGTGRVRVFEIPGLHRHIFDPPEVYWLASRLAHCLQDGFSAADDVAPSGPRRRAVADPA